MSSSKVLCISVFYSSICTLMGFLGWSLKNNETEYKFHCANTKKEVKSMVHEAGVEGQLGKLLSYIKI